MEIFCTPTSPARALFASALVTFATVSNVSAQTLSAAPQAKRTTVMSVQTDSAFANKTTVYTRKGVSDAKVLEEISNDYSLGDEVRITTAVAPKVVQNKAETPVKERVEIVPKNLRVPTPVYTLEQIMDKPDAAVLPVGSIIRTQQMRFAKDAATLDPSSYPYMDAVYKYLKDHPAVIIEVGGHTNMLPSQEYSLELSVNRAKAIVAYLVNKGVATSRLRMRGYGKTQPLVVAYNEAAHQVNQRVEIKVLANN